MRPETDDPVGFVVRTRIYYNALGYNTDFVLSAYGDVPSADLKLSLAQSKITLVTTANSPRLTNRDDAGGKYFWRGDVGSPPTSFVVEIARDREPTHTKDSVVFADRCSFSLGEGKFDCRFGRAFHWYSG